MPDTAKAPAFHTVSTPVEVSVYRIRCLLCSAFEGGSNYWIESVENILAEGLKPEDFRKGGKFTTEDYWPSHMLVPFHEECAVKINTSRMLPRRTETSLLNIESMRKGLELMAAWDVKHHWQAFLNEDDDAETGDVFLQFCVFGEVIFG